MKRLPGPNLPFFSPFYASLPHFSLLNAPLAPFDSTYIIFSQGIVPPLSGNVFPDSHPDEPVLGQNVVITGLKPPPSSLLSDSSPSFMVQRETYLLYSFAHQPCTVLEVFLGIFWAWDIVRSDCVFELGLKPRGP